MNNSDGSDSPGQGRSRVRAWPPWTSRPVCRWRGTRAATRAAPRSSPSSRPRAAVDGQRHRRTSATTATAAPLAFFPLAGGYGSRPPRRPRGSRAPSTWPGPGGCRQGNVLYRVNAGGGDGRCGRRRTGLGRRRPALSSPYRNSGSNAAGYARSVTSDATVPSDTPNAVFDSERWSPSDNPRMQWAFPAPDGRRSRCGSTSPTATPGPRAAGQPGLRRVASTGPAVLDNFDIVQHGVTRRGTMRPSTSPATARSTSTSATWWRTRSSTRSRSCAPTRRHRRQASNGLSSVTSAAPRRLARGRGRPW